ncbi:hypothetical protein QE152_g10308 [Popillia japonica]|uniref:MADF domain-containing protein n=1 Tax=Popillia japonica TaxID=7064 RepID=A0AAW1LVP5_POPJA
MWEEIASDIKKILELSYTYIQVENRYKTVLKQKKESIENNSRSGASRLAIPFESELNKITAIDDSIIPEVLISGNLEKHPKGVCSNESTSQEPRIY